MARSRARPYEPTAYRGVLQEQQGLAGVAIRDWPWTDLTPADFTLPSDPNVLPQGTATLTPEQAAALGVDGFENGIASGIFLRDDAGEGLLVRAPAAAPRRAGVIRVS